MGEGFSVIEIVRERMEAFPFLFGIGDAGGLCRCAKVIQFFSRILNFSLDFCILNDYFDTAYF